MELIDIFITGRDGSGVAPLWSTPADETMILFGTNEWGAVEAMSLGDLEDAHGMAENWRSYGYTDLFSVRAKVNDRGRWEANTDRNRIIF